MRVLLAKQDHSPGGFNHTRRGDILRLGEVCDRTDDVCGCDRAFTGHVSLRGATLAEVTETPPCFSLREEDKRNTALMRCLQIATKYEVGTLLRVRFDRDAGEWTFYPAAS